MNNSGAKDLTVVKTSDLIYVFCAAAWVNVLTSNFNDGANWLCYTLAFLTFALIPLELYTGSLWQQAVSIVDENPSDDAFQQSILAALDIFRLFALTMVFILLYIPLKILKDLPRPIEGHTSLEAYVVFIAIFLASNWIWNQILFKGRFCRNSNTKPDYYKVILDKYKEVMRSNNTGLENHPGNKLLSQIMLFAEDFTVSFGGINRFLFERLFLWIFFALFVLSILSFTFEPVHNYLLSYVGWLSFGIFGLQIGAKLVQIVYFSNVVSDIRAAQSKILTSSGSLATGVTP